MKSTTLMVLGTSGPNFISFSVYGTWQKRYDLIHCSGLFSLYHWNLEKFLIKKFRPNFILYVK